MQVDRCVSYAAYAALTETNLARLITGVPDRAEKERLLTQLFPAFRQTYALAYAQPEEPLSGPALQQLYDSGAAAICTACPSSAESTRTRCATGSKRCAA